MRGLRRATGWITLLMGLLSASSSVAMRPAHESLERVLARASAAIVADIGSVEERSDRQIYRELVFAATPVEILFGEGYAAPLLDCRYEQGLVHRRGDLVVAPLISGSGMEFDIKSGDRVILLIAGDGTRAGTCQVLRIEPLDRGDAIKQLAAARSRDTGKQ
jgi:hypothetical protein